MLGLLLVYGENVSYIKNGYDNTNIDILQERNIRRLSSGSNKKE